VLLPGFLAFFLLGFLGFLLIYQTGTQKLVCQ
jgi:hypothetical protein